MGGLAGAAYGAQEGLDQYLTRKLAAQMQAQQIATQEQAAQRAADQASMQRQTFQQGQQDRAATQAHVAQQDRELAALEQDPTLPAPVRQLISLRRRGVTGINSVADLTPKEAPIKPPEHRQVVAVRGPKGEKIEKSLTDTELAQGVQGYVEPKAAPAEKAKVWVTRGGMPAYIDPAQVQPGDAPFQQRGQKTPTGADRQAFAYYNRAKSALDTIEGGDPGKDMETQIAQQGVLGQAGTLMLPNAMQSQLGQSYRQAQRAFTEARLRKESGAAINDAEYAKDARTYFAQPGDSPQTITQKRAARKQVVEGLAFASGPAYEEYYGEAFKPMSANVDATHLGNVPAQGGGGASTGGGSSFRVVRKH